MSLENQINCTECNKLNPYDAKFCGFCGMNLVEVMDTDLLLLQTELEPKHYKIKKRLGQGGMASVYLAEQIKLERLVAVKILSKELSENKEMRERFLSEARTEAKIKHYAIVEIFDVGVVDGRPYFIME